MDLHPAESGRSSLSPEVSDSDDSSAERDGSRLDQGIADHLKAALRETGVSYQALADSISKSKTTATCIINGSKPLRWDHIRAFHPSLRARFFQRLADEATRERDGKRPPKDVDANVRAVVTKQGEYVASIGNALADNGRIDAHEVPGIVRCGNEYADAVRLAVRDVAAGSR